MANSIIDQQIQDDEFLPYHSICKHYGIDPCQTLEKGITFVPSTILGTEEIAILDRLDRLCENKRIFLWPIQ